MNQPDYACSPCIGCTRIKDPKKCENKKCHPWRQWFLASWERLRTRSWDDDITRKMESMDRNPCASCSTKETTCVQPCFARRVWNRKVKEV